MRNRELREIYSFALEADGKESPKMQPWYFDAGWRLINLSTQKPLWRVLPLFPGAATRWQKSTRNSAIRGPARFCAQHRRRGEAFYFARVAKGTPKSSGNHPNLTNENVCFLIVWLQLHIQAPAKCPSMENVPNNELKCWRFRRESFGISKHRVPFKAGQEFIDTISWGAKK